MSFLKFRNQFQFFLANIMSSEVVYRNSHWLCITTGGHYFKCVLYVYVFDPCDVCGFDTVSCSLLPIQ